VKLNRRSFLRGVGGTAVGLPFLNAMRTVARGGATGVPKRLVVFYSPNGFEMSGWPTSMSLGGTSLEPLAPFASDLIVTAGLDMQSAFADPNPNDGSHYNGWAHCLVADDSYPVPGDSAGRTGGNVSFDMLVADRIGRSTRFVSSLHGICSENNPLSWLGPNMPAIPDDDPQAVFSRLFSDLSVAPSELDRVRSRRQSILDFVSGSTERLACRLGAEDRVRLDAHLTAVRDVEARLGATASIGAACAAPGAPSEDGRDPSRYPDIGRAHMDLLAMGLACDLTRVGSIQWSHAADGKIPFWLGLSENHHDISHQTSDDARRSLIRINTWYAEQLAYFLGLLRGMPEGDGTVLDNTVVAWVSEGGPDGGHNRRDLRITLAGGSAVGLRTGQFLSFPGTAHNNLWVELINLLSPSTLAPVTTFGNAEVCTGGLPQIRA